jgi:hypothetical protein
VASHATRSSKSETNPDPCLEKGTPSTTTPCSGQRNRRNPAQTMTFHVPRSNARHDEFALRVSCRAAVENAQCGHTNRRLRNRTVTTTRSRLEGDLADPHAEQTQNLVECGSDAHGEMTFQDPRLDTADPRSASCASLHRPPGRPATPLTRTYPPSKPTSHPQLLQERLL